MSSEDQPAIRIDAGSVFKCRFPPPSHEMFSRISDGLAVADRASPDGLSYEEEVRFVYAALALEAGARPEGIRDEQ